MRPKKVVQAGRLVGQITFDGTRPTPKYRQLGNIVERILGVTYLAVKVGSACILSLAPAPAPTPALSPPSTRTDH